MKKRICDKSTKSLEHQYKSRLSSLDNILQNYESAALSPVRVLGRMSVGVS